MKILLVDDDPLFAGTLAQELHMLSHDVVVADDWRGMQQAVDGDQFDAVVLDRMLPGSDGIAILQRLRRENVTLPVIMLSALGRSIEKVEGLDAGADDYVVKPVPAGELSARIIALVRGRRWMATAADDTLRVGDIVVSPRRFRAWRANRPMVLAKLEMKLLTELAQHAGTVLTRAMLIERIWGYTFGANSNIVDVYVRHLRRKLTAHGGDDPIVTVRGIGYMLQA